mmetsp:Transcript_5753/g.13376  ORF Transcript_5753/g.13376 Transcript_5753/m.13376 type:complete len:202 (+) Transcript_5753:2947-3552(+)
MGRSVSVSTTGSIAVAVAIASGSTFASLASLAHQLLVGSVDLGKSVRGLFLVFRVRMNVGDNVGMVFQSPLFVGSLQDLFIGRGCIQSQNNKGIVAQKSHLVVVDRTHSSLCCCRSRWCESMIPYCCFGSGCSAVVENPQQGNSMVRIRIDVANAKTLVPRNIVVVVACWSCEAPTVFQERNRCGVNSQLGRHHHSNSRIQ